MTQKKATIKDVAKAAGVSVATVSYVVNNRTDLKISDETKKKVLQVCNLLNYTPNQAAKALATNRRHMLGFAYEKTDSLLLKSQQLYLLESLISFFREKGYELLLVDADLADKYDQVDAIICYGLSSKHFHDLGDKNYSPLIAIDSYINDDLFFQINTNLENLKKESVNHFGNNNFLYLLLEPQNNELKDAILNTFDNIMYYDSSINISSLSNRNILLTDYALYKKIGDNNTYYVPSFNNLKFIKLYESIESALSRDSAALHQIYI